jgi:uncharacterized protein (TIGR02453 family)
MPNRFDLAPVLDFLDHLSHQNNKAWFDDHRLDYEAARAEFYRFVDHLTDEFRVSDRLEGLAANACAARIFRDIRFSKDKSPYKTNLSAMIAPGGWRSSRYGYYVSVAPRGQSIVAGGLYQPTPGQLGRFRQAMDLDPAPFRKLTRARAFVEAFGAIEGESLKTAPQGYDQTHSAIELLRLKQVTAVHHFSDQDVLGPGFFNQVVRVCRAMKPFLAYLERVAA